MAGEQILVVDDERSMREFLEIMLRKVGYETNCAEDGEQSLDLLQRSIFDLIILDIKMPGLSGMEVLRRIKEQDPEMLVIMITAYGSTREAVEAMKLGAYDYITKPFEVEEIKLVVEKALERRRLARENIFLRQSLGEIYGYGELVGASQVMQRLFQLIRQVAPTQSNILITGDTGVGKGMVARAIHQQSHRRDRPFVTVSCGAIPETLLESELFGHRKGAFTGAHANKLGLFKFAEGGSIFFDEVSELPLSLQVKILRAIEEKVFRPIGATEDIHSDVRVISATNRRLDDYVREGRFREDLYYRLKVIEINVPPLRERREDIPALVDVFVKKYSQQMNKKISGLADPALKIIKNYDFPGNVRELENIIERAVALERTSLIQPPTLPAELTREDVVAQFIGQKQEDVVAQFIGQKEKGGLPEHYVGSGRVYPDERGSGRPLNLDKTVEDLEKSLISRALKRAGGVKTKAAELLGITFRSLRYRLKKYNM